MHSESQSNEYLPGSDDGISFFPKREIDLRSPPLLNVVLVWICMIKRAMNDGE
jgi:hypothetical protein